MVVTGLILGPSSFNIYNASGGHAQADSSLNSSQCSWSGGGVGLPILLYIDGSNAADLRLSWGYCSGGSTVTRPKVAYGYGRIYLTHAARYQEHAAAEGLQGNRNGSGFEPLSPRRVIEYYVSAYSISPPSHRLEWTAPYGGIDAELTEGTKLFH